jgi:hypothetical protein
MSQAGPAQKDDQAKIAEIINAVRDHEQLYRNLSFECEETLETLRPADVKADPRWFQTAKYKSRLVLQKELVFYDQTQQGASGNGTFDFGYRQAYDGETFRDLTHSVHQGKKGDVGHIATGLQPKLPSPLTPQQMGCRLDSSLSEYLDGSRLKKLSRPVVQENTYLGEESVDGLRCVKMQILLKSKTPDGKDQVDKDLLWLAPERNYLPVKSETFVAPFVDHPFVTMQASDFREVQPGVYVPFRGEKVNYSKRKDGSTVPGSRTVSIVKAVDLNPSYPISFFRDVPFPPGALIYVQKGDNFVMSYTQPAPEAPPPSFFVRWRAALISLAALIAACVCVAIVIAYRRRMA